MSATACQILKNGDMKIFNIKKQKWILIRAKKIFDCPKCDKRMKNIKDSITKKINKHLFTCKCLNGKVVSIG